MTHYAGVEGRKGSKNGPRQSAEFHCPAGICVDNDGTVILVELGTCMLRYITPAGEVSTMKSVKLSSPFCVCVNRETGDIFVTDLKDHCIYQITRVVKERSDGTKELVCQSFRRITPCRRDEYFKIYAGVTLARGIGVLCCLNVEGSPVRRIISDNRLELMMSHEQQEVFEEPCALAYDSKRHILYIADTDAHCIYKAVRRKRKKKKGSGGTATSGGAGYNSQFQWVLSLMCGEKGTRGCQDHRQGRRALFAFPIDIALDAKRNRLYVADSGNDALRMVHTITSKVTTLAKGARKLGSNEVTAERFSPVQRMRTFMQIGILRDAVGPSKAAYRVVGVKCVLHNIMTFLGPVFRWRLSLKPGTICDAEDSGPINYPTRWFEAVVVAITRENSNMLKVHFKGWKPRFDEYISRWSSRIQPPHTKVRKWRQFRVGQLLDAQAQEVSGWFEAKVVEVDKDNQKVKLEYLGIGSGLPLQWKDMQSESICSRHTHVPRDEAIATDSDTSADEGAVVPPNS